MVSKLKKEKKKTKKPNPPTPKDIIVKSSIELMTERILKYN